MRRILANALSRAGCEQILQASDGQQALEHCDGATDILVTAWDLPGLSGIELVRRLRANPDTGGIRILMVTTRNTREDVLEAVRAGVDGYLLKPLEPETLRRKIDALLAPEAGPAVLSTQRDNERALALYRRRGWRVIVPEIDFGAGYPPFCVLGKDPAGGREP